MRVLHIVTGLASGGAERQLHLLLRHLPPHQRCEVLTLTNPGTVADALRADGVTVHHLAMRGNRDLGALPRLVRLVRAGRYDLVHTHLYRAQLYGRLAARLAGVRAVVSTEHSLHAGVIEAGRSPGASRASTWPPSGSAAPPSRSPGRSPRRCGPGASRRPGSS